MPGTSTRWWLTEDSSETIVAAAPQRMYDLVADLPRMGEWSPECQRVEWESGSAGPADGPVAGPVAGATFVGHNRGGPRGLMKWSRRGRVLVADPGREFTFVTEEGGRESTVWRYRFEPTDGGTRVTESYEVKRIPAWARIVDVPTNRARELREAMEHTLARLKAAAEARDEAGRP
jgi:hypothetical protein